MGRSHKYIPGHDLIHQLGHSVAKALPGFHTFTSCDTVSSFHERGRKHVGISSNFILSSYLPLECYLKLAPLLNKFTARLYQNNDEFRDVDSLRLLLLIHKGKSFDSMPPGSDSLKLKSYRTGYQGDYIWGNMLVPIMNPPSPSEC